MPPQEPVANTTAAPAPNGRGAAPRARDRSGDAGRSPRSARVSDTKAPRKGRDRTEPRSHQNGDEDDVVTTHPTESATQSPVTRGTDRLPTQPSPHRGSNPRCSNPNREPSEVSTATDFTEGTSPLVTPAVRTTHSTARRTLTTTMTTASSQMPMSGSERTQQPTVVVSSIGSSTWTAGGMSTDTTTPIVSAQWANIPVPHRSPSKRREMLEQLKEEAGAIERANQERAAAAAAACAAAAGNTSN